MGPLALAIDNHLTRKVTASDALFIAGSKGLVAGRVNTAWRLRSAFHGFLALRQGLLVPLDAH